LTWALRPKMINQQNQPAQCHLRRPAYVTVKIDATMLFR